MPSAGQLITKSHGESLGFDMTPPAKAALSILILVGVCLFALDSKADSLMLGGWSTHLFSDDSRYNQTHDLIAVQAGPLLVAGFENSHNRESYAVAYGWQWRDSAVRADLYLGAVRGYRGCYNDGGDAAVICPLIVPAISYTGLGSIQPTLLLMGQALTFTLRIDW